MLFHCYISCLLYATFIIHSIYAAPFTVEPAEDNNLIQDDNSTIPKIPKCCQLNESLLNPSEGCAVSDIKFLPPFTGLEPKEVDIIIGLGCEHGKYRLEPSEAPEDVFHLLADGTLSTPLQKQTLYSPLEYCLENTIAYDKDGKETIEVLPFLCFPPPDSLDSWRRLSHILFPIGSLISVPFLVAVVILYLAIPELRTTHGQVLACHSSCLAFAYVSLSIVQLFGDELPNTFCIIMAFLIQFSFMSCFFWLNVLCLHTWRQLNKGYEMGEVNTVASRTLFIIYSLYGWGIPIIIICVSVVMDLTPSIPSSYLKPNFGLDSCWFHTDNAALPYFYGPITLLLIANVVYFIMTTRILHRSRNSTRITSLQQAVIGVIVKKRRNSFVQAVLLFLAMGLNWLLEVISWVVGGPPQLWLLTDIINTLQGIIVFYIFVLQDPWVRRLSYEYFRRVCCCRNSNDGIVLPEEERINQQKSDTNINRKRFQQLIPLVTANKDRLMKDSTDSNH
ncbi:hypothetical protein O3M35_010680 [Rhynocoris fuscipes]|uniref:G-protein coupled receptors family 2 profile 2 domain-containing protein n=1 Tax=Rhynocoris fuscipes TaxID=488301 RepID=A0AAW1D198_9HEMI